MNADVSPRPGDINRTGWLPPAAGASAVAAEPSPSSALGSRPALCSQAACSAGLRVLAAAAPGAEAGYQTRSARRRGPMSPALASERKASVSVVRVKPTAAEPVVAGGDTDAPAVEVTTAGASRAVARRRDLMVPQGSRREPGGAMGFAGGERCLFRHPRVPLTRTAAPSGRSGARRGAPA